MSKFQRIFKNLREQKNMTQEELAKALGVSKSTIGMYERGDREPNFEKLEVIADYFNVNMSDLIDSKNIASEILPASKIGVRSHTVAERLNEVMTIRGLKQADVLNLAKPYCDKYKIKLSKNESGTSTKKNCYTGDGTIGIRTMAYGIRCTNGENIRLFQHCFK